MGRKPIRDERIIEAIESCRPGTDDVSDPALAFLAAELSADPELDDLYERLQRLDARLAEVFADVPVPEGLADRILGGIASRTAAASCQSEQIADVSGQTPATDAATPLSPARKTSRRRWFAAAAVALSVAASVLIAVVQFQRPVAMSEDDALGRAIDFFVSDTLAEQGTELTEGNEPEDFPFSRHVRFYQGTSFRPIEGFLECDGVAYDMTNHRGVAATLYVVQRRGVVVPGLPSLPPSYRRAFRTRNCCSVAWESDGLLYVLVVGGSSKQTYNSFLPIQGPVT